MSEPRTKAGRALLDRMPYWKNSAHNTDEEVTAAILAIEAEAHGDLTDLAAEITKDWNGRCADLSAQIEKAVRDIPVATEYGEGFLRDVKVSDFRDAVLVVIRSAAPVEPT